MARTIVIFTSGRSIYRLSGLTADEINARVKPQVPIYSSNGDEVVLLLDEDVGERIASNELSEFTAVRRTGSLHYVYHTTPQPNGRASFISALKLSSPDLGIGPGFEGEHNSDPALRKAYPYQRLATWLKGGGVTQEDFDDLWCFLNGDPILEDLILLLKTHAAKKAGKVEISDLETLKSTVNGEATIGEEALAKVRENLNGVNSYETLRTALIKAVVKQEGMKRG